MTDDRDLWKRICDGDTAAFNDLYRDLAPRIYAFVRRTTGNTHAAEDVVQETFTEFWKRLDRYNPETGSLRSWLFGIARKRAADWWRKQNAYEPELDEPVAAVQIELSSLLNEAMAQLARPQRQLLWLREVEGQSYEELAVIFEIPLGTVRSRLFAAREAFRNIWLSEPREQEVPHEVQ